MDPIKYFLQVPQYDELLKLIIEQCAGRNNGHLWFLCTLFTLFVFFKILCTVRIIGKTSVFREVVLYICLLLCSIYSSNFYFFKSITSYAVFFYLGYLLNKYSETMHSKKIFILVLSVACLFLFMLLYFGGIIYYGKFFNILIACLVIVNVYNIDFKIIKESSIIKLISNCSFGIYLFHSPLIYITFTYWKDVNPFVVLLINFFLFGCLALCITLLIKRTKLKFVIGE